MANKYQDLIDVVTATPSPEPGEPTPSAVPSLTPQFNFSPTPKNKYQDLIDNVNGPSATPSATAMPSQLPSPPQPSLTPLTDAALKAQLDSTPSTPVPSTPWYNLGVSESAPGLFEPLYKPERVVGGQTQIPDAPFMPVEQFGFREPPGMQQNLGAPPMHTAGNTEATMMNLVNGFVSGSTSARGLVTYLPPLFLIETAKSFNPLAKDNIYNRIRDADKTPAWSQERMETGMAMVMSLASLGFMGKSAWNMATRWPETFTKPMPALQPQGQPPPEAPPPAGPVQPGEKGFVMTARPEIPGVKYNVGDVGPARERTTPVILEHRGKTFALDPASGQWMERVETEGGAAARVLEPETDRNLIDELDFKLRKGGETDASSQPSATGVPGEQVRTGVDEEASLRQPGQTPAARPEGTQPQPAPSVVASPIPEKPDVEEGKRPPVAKAPEKEEKKKKSDADRIAELEAEKAEAAKTGQPFSLLKSSELSELKAKAPDSRPINQLLSKKDLAAHDRLQSHWSQLDFLMEHATSTNNKAEVLDIQRKQARIKREMQKIESKLPDSDVYDVIAIGSGPTGQTAGITAGSEDLSMLGLDVMPAGGASRFTPLYENVTGAITQTGRQRALAGKLSAERHGTQFQQIYGIESVTQDPKTGIWTIKTTGPGEFGGGGKTFKARTILASTGTKAHGAPFPVRNAEGKVVTRGAFDRHADQSLPVSGSTEDKSGSHIWLSDGKSAAIEAHKAGDGNQAVIGGANSAGQGALDMALSARKYNGKPAIIINRSPRLSMSGYLQKNIYELKREGWIKVMLNTVVDHMKIGPNGERTLVLHTSSSNPKGYTETELPVDSIASFTGGDPITDWMPEGIKKDPKGFVEAPDFRPLGEDGKPLDNGFYVAGSVRSGAVSRMPPSEGEGVAAMERIGKYITDLEKEGKLPRWKMELRDYFNRDEYMRQQRPPGHEPPPVRGKTQEPQPLSEKPSTVPDEPEPAPSPPLDWSDIGKPPKLSLKHRPTKPVEHVTSAVSSIEQQQQQGGAGSPFDYADALIARMLTGVTKSLDTADQMILTRHRAALQTMRDDVAKRMTNQNLSNGQKAEAAATFEDLESQIRMMDTALKGGDLITSKPLSDAWHSFRMKDYSPESMKLKLEAAKDGMPLTADETKFIETQSAKLEDATAAIAARKIETRWRPGQTGDTRLRDLQLKQFKAKEALDHAIFAATLRSKGKLAQTMHIGGEIMGLPRVLMTSMDLSAVLRQGGLLMMSHPLRSIGEFPAMLKAARSDKGYFNVMQDIRERPNADLYKESGLGITDLSTPKLAEMEEAYMSRWAEKIPLVAGSQRAYVAYLNLLRADSFDIMAKNLPRNGAPTEAQAEAISNYINVFTGRGNPGSWGTAMAKMNNIFFAPRYQLSRFQALIGQPLYYAWARSPEVRNAIAMEYARTMAGMGAVYTLANVLGGDDVQIEFNPLSTDFGKVRIGDTRFDLMYGLGQATVFTARLLTGKTKSATGETQSLYGPNVPLSQRDVDSVITTFMRSKLAPVPSALWNIAKGKKVTGEQTDALSELGGMLFPMTGQDIYNAMRKYGVPRTTAIALASFFGLSVQDYAPKVSYKSSPKPHRVKAHPSSSESRQRDRKRF